MKERELKMKEACQTSDPCKAYGEKVSGCAPGLTSIGGSHKLNPTAAKQYLKMVDAAKQDGVEWKITDSYRELKIQCNILDWDHFEKTGKKKKIKTAGTPVAFPGNSNHGWGSAVDLGAKYGDKAHTWLTNNAAKFGFSNPFKNPRTEPWHWEHVESAKALKSGLTPMDSGSDVSTTSTSGDTESSSGSDTNKSGGLGALPALDLIGGAGFTDFINNLGKDLQKKGENKGKKPEDENQDSSSLNEELHRIKDLIKKVL
jgi:hypothetical protein